MDKQFLELLTAKPAKPPKPDPVILVRTEKLKKDQVYGIPRTSLIKKWVIKTPDTKAIIIINGVPIVFPGMDGATFDAEKIRNFLRNIEPFDTNSNKLVTVESALVSSQLLAIEHYKYFSVKHFNNFFFTGGMCISFQPSKELDEILIEEHYVSPKMQVQCSLTA